MFPRLRIHSWGGFGSQLNALAFALALKERHPNRRLHLVFHTSGVTERALEIQKYIPCDMTFEVISDFKLERDGGKRLTYKQIVKRFLRHLPLVTTPNNTEDFASIRMWTLATRGHYSYINFSDSVVQKLLNILDLDVSDSLAIHQGVVHYRLGDLLTLNKGYVSVQSLFRKIEETNCKNWVILSDSPEYARQQLIKEANLSYEFKVATLSPQQVLNYALNGTFFIGTNSKLSIWASIFRLKMTKLETYMPLELKSTFVKILDPKEMVNIIFY